MTVAYVPGAAERPERAALAAYVAEVAREAAAALPGFESILWKGSAVKPWDGPYDFLPGLSDLDVHVYRAGGQGDAWDLRERIAGLGPAPGDTPLQLMVLDSTELPEWWTLVPGTYRVLHGGEPPVPHPPRDLLLARDEIGLAEAGGQANLMDAEIVTVPDDGLWEYLRRQRGVIPSALYRVASVLAGEPLEVWALNRTGVLARLAAEPEVAAVHRAGVAYLDAALAAGARPGSPRPAAAALRSGQHLLRTAGAWYAARPDARTDRRTREV